MTLSRFDVLHSLDSEDLCARTSRESALGKTPWCWQWKHSCLQICWMISVGRESILRCFVLIKRKCRHVVTLRTNCLAKSIFRVDPAVELPPRYWSPDLPFDQKRPGWDFVIGGAARVLMIGIPRSPSQAKADKGTWRAGRGEKGVRVQYNIEIIL